MDKRSRGEVILDMIYDDVDQRLNPDREECWHCGGDGETWNCIDDCCIDADIGCELCRTPCIECRIYAGRRARAIREEVIKADDVDVAIAWLKHIGRWRDGITEEQVKEQLAVAKVAVTSGLVRE